MRFSGKSILITGGSSGIGAACAERFAAEGGNVVLVQRRASDQYPTIQGDLSRPETCVGIMKSFAAISERLDVLINNAGVMHEATVEELELKQWQETMDVNVTSPMLLIKYALPYLRASRGTIVNIGSIEGLGSNPTHPAYCASKGALHALTRAIAVDHGRDGIRCNAVAPGWVNTDLNHAFIEAQPNPIRFREKIANIHPLRRTGSPQEIAALVTYLASEDASFITGQVLTIDGGRMAQLSLPT